MSGPPIGSNQRTTPITPLPVPLLTHPPGRREETSEGHYSQVNEVRIETRDDSTVIPRGESASFLRPTQKRHKTIISERVAGFLAKGMGTSWTLRTRHSVTGLRGLGKPCVPRKTASRCGSNNSRSTRLTICNPCLTSDSFTSNKRSSVGWAALPPMNVTASACLFANSERTPC